MTADVRRMTAADAEQVADVVKAASDDEYRRSGAEPPPQTPEQHRQFLRGMRRFTETDADGAWVAENDDGIVGMAEAIRRGPFWGLSMLFVHPSAQSKGIGRQLLDKTLAYADGAGSRMIMTSEDPRALRRYGMAGLTIHPAVKAEGTVERTAIPARLPGREGSVDDVELVRAVDERMLGRSRADDVAFVLGNGGHLEVVDEGEHRGFALMRIGNVNMLGATDEQTAAALLWRVLASTSGDTELYCLTAQQDWAVKVALAARLKVSPGGPLFVSGVDRLPVPWIPSGWYF